MKRKTIKNCITYILLTVFAIITVYPFLWMLSGSLKSMQDLLINSTSIIPNKLHFENYSQGWQTARVGLYYINSIIITISALAILLISTYLAAFPLARLNIPGGRWIMVGFVAFMMVPMQVIIVPLYKFEVLLHINNTYLGLILPYAAGSLPFSIYLMTSFLKTIPLAIEEAAIVDGCGRLRMILNIFLPLSKPGFATVIIFSFMAIWNEFFLALILMQNRALGTLNLGLIYFQSTYQFNATFVQMFAVLVMILTPVLIVYAIFQKQFISGLTAGAVKS